MDVGKCWEVGTSSAQAECFCEFTEKYSHQGCLSFTHFSVALT